MWGRGGERLVYSPRCVRACVCVCASVGVKGSMFAWERAQTDRQHKVQEEKERAWKGVAHYIPQAFLLIRGAAVSPSDPRHIRITVPSHQDRSPCCLADIMSSDFSSEAFALGVAGAVSAMAFSSMRHFPLLLQPSIQERHPRLLVDRCTAQSHLELVRWVQ